MGAALSDPMAFQERYEAWKAMYTAALSGTMTPQQISKMAIEAATADMRRQLAEQQSAQVAPPVVNMPAAPAPVVNLPPTQVNVQPPAVMMHPSAGAKTTLIDSANHLSS